MKESIDFEIALEDIDEVLESGRSFVVPFVITVEGNEIFVEAYSDAIDIAHGFVEYFHGRWFTKGALDELNRAFSDYLEGHGYYIDGYGKYRYYNSFMRCSPLSPNEAAKIKANTFAVTEVDADVVNLTGLCADDGDGLPELSFVTVEDGKIVSVATVNDFYADDEVVEITVKTATGYRGRGYGGSNVRALTNTLISLGKKVAYCCSKNNYSSIKLAKSCGFEATGRMYAVCGWSDN